MLLKAALRPCAHAGCPVLVSKGRCPAHLRAQRTEQDQRRPNFRQRGYSTQWDKLRKWHIQREPLCIDCKAEGRVRIGDEVDHVVPVHVAPDRVLDPTNLQTLCRHHHALKTARDQKLYRGVSNE